MGGSAQHQGLGESDSDSFQDLGHWLWPSCCCITSLVWVLANFMQAQPKSTCLHCTEHCCLLPLAFYFSKDGNNRGFETRPVPRWCISEVRGGYLINFQCGRWELVDESLLCPPSDTWSEVCTGSLDVSPMRSSPQWHWIPGVASSVMISCPWMESHFSSLSLFSPLVLLSWNCTP